MSMLETFKEKNTGYELLILRKNENLLI